MSIDRTPRSWRQAAWFAGVLLALTPSIAGAQPGTFPQRAIRIIVPAAAGTLPDRIARGLTGKLTTIWRQDVVIENRPSAATAPPPEFAGRPGNDGHTLLLVSPPVPDVSIAGPPIPVRADLLRSVLPVILLARAPLLLATRPDRGLDSIEIVRAHAQAHPRKLSLRAGPAGSVESLAARVLAGRIALTIDATPHTALVGPADPAADLQLGPVAILLKSIEAGIAKPLLVFSDRRVPVLRDVPLAADKGLVGIDLEAWYGIGTALAVSGDTLARLHADIAQALSRQDVHDALIDAGLTPVGSTPAEFGTILAREQARYMRIANMFERR